MTKSCGCLNDEVRRQKHVSSEATRERRKRNWHDWYKRNRETQIKKATAEMCSNREAWNARRRKRVAERMTDPHFRLAKNLRSRLRVALKTDAKTGSAVADLGCSIEELKLYLEAKFYDRSDGTPMNWSNYGRIGWRIDHVKPLAYLRMGRAVEELCHYKNLQPLWYEDNIAKRRGGPRGFPTTGRAAAARTRTGPRAGGGSGSWPSSCWGTCSSSGC
jgi:hypothetical protein